jgi:TetR/AcrR family transcriptional regulator, fatty acid metabolism regulator protein
LTGKRSGTSRRRQIRDAAVRVFAERGFHAARVSDIAAEAGVAHGLVYHYFSSKDEVLQEIFRTTWGWLDQGLRLIRASDAGAQAKLAEVVRIMLGSYRLAPDVVRVLVLEVTRSGHLRRKVEEISQAFELIEGMIADGQASGELRRDVDPALASYVLWGAVDELLTGWVFGTIPDGDADIRAAEHTVVEVVLAGLQPREASNGEPRGTLLPDESG